MYEDFQQLPVWKIASQLAVDVFGLTENLPRKEDYGLTSQIRRSSLSISDNIALGVKFRDILDERKLTTNISRLLINFAKYANCVIYIRLETSFLCK